MKSRTHRVPLALSVILVAISSMACQQIDNAADGTSANVDPNILQDVVDATYMAPGVHVRRAMRVNNFLRGVGLVECGGGPVPLDSTSDRYSQDLFPDLDLIKEKGLVERTQGYSTDVDADCPNLAPDSLQSWPRWFGLIGEWTDVAYTIKEESPQVAAHKETMSVCLKDRTGLDFDEYDPTSFLRAVNIAGSSGDELLSWSAAYADCGQDYFAAMEEEMMKRREPLVERNREILVSFAQELAEAGYVP